MNNSLNDKKKYILPSWLFIGTLAFSANSLAFEYEFSLGGQVGYSSSRSQFVDKKPNLSEETAEYPINGPILGLYANASILWDSWIMGLEVDYTGREQSTRVVVEDLLAETVDKRKLSFVDRQDLSLLVGYQYSDQVRFYLRGGVSTATYEFSSFDTEEGSSKHDLNLQAPHYGFGVRINLNENLSIRTDYRFATFSDRRRSGVSTTDYEFEVHTFLLGLGYTF